MARAPAQWLTTLEPLLAIRMMTVTRVVTTLSYPGAHVLSYLPLRDS